MQEETLTEINDFLLKQNENNSNSTISGKNIQKYKILALTDFPLGISGVGNMANILISKLVETGKYSFKVLGGAIKHQNYNTIQVNEDYIIKPVDGFGNRDIVVSLLLQEQFDAVFIFTDPRQYIWLWEMEDEIKQVCPIVYWHVWDNDPYPKFNNTWYKGTELLNCISWKTYEMVKPHFPEKTNYIPHAWPKDMYFKMQDQQVSALKSQFFGSKSNWFMPIWVNRNAHRKMPNDLLMGWKMFLDLLEEREGHKNAALIMHTNPTDIEGPNLQEVVNELGLIDNVAFSVNPLNHNEMNQLYNMSDCVVNVSKAEGFGLCLDGNTLIKTGKYVKLSDIEVGDKVWSSNGKYNKVLAKSERLENKIIEITPYGRDKIISSYEHPFQVYENNKLIWKKASELNKKDLLCVRKPIMEFNEVSDEVLDITKFIDINKYHYDNNCVWSNMGYSGYKNGLSITDIQKQYKLSKFKAECIRRTCLGLKTKSTFNPNKYKKIIDEININYKVNNNIIKIKRFIKLDKEFYEMSGWYLAEGSSGGGNGLEFSLSYDEIKVAEWLKKYFELNFGVLGSYEIYGSNQTKSRFYVSSKIISNLFENLFGKYAKNKSINNYLIKNMSNFKFDLLKTLFLGDGHHNKKKKFWNFCTISPYLSKQVADLLLNNGIFCSIKTNYKNNKSKNKIFNIYVYSKNYKQLNINFNIKNEDYNTIKKSKIIQNNNYYFIPINKLNEKDLDQSIKLYDIQVENSKDFEANGVIVHNSALTGLQIGKPIIGLKTGGMTRQLIDYRDGFEHGVALEPVERSLIGSQMVPYIYEDIVGKKDLAEAFYKVYKYTPEEKELIGKRSMSYVDFEMNLDNVIAEWNRTLEDTIVQFKNGKFPLWELVSLDRKDDNNKKEIETKSEVKSKFIINQPKGRK